MNNDLVVRINPAEIVQCQQDGKAIVFNPNAEDAIVQLLEIQREVGDAVEWLKSEIERQALEYNENFTSVKGDKIKVNYSAAGAKYKEDGTCSRHPAKFWKKKISWSLDSKAIDEHLARRCYLPAGIVEVSRKKTIRISEVKNAER
jgi:hypothetical protein